ncbi:MAG: hypothetical protein AAF961_00290 [Planctomycetota bacterium]
MEGDDGLYAVVRTGDLAPGAGLAYTQLWTLQLTKDGDVVFSARLDGVESNSGIWTTAVDGLAPIVIAGQVDADGDVVHPYHPTFRMAANRSGDVAYVTYSRHADSDSPVESLWKYSDGASQRLLQSGDPAPGSGGVFTRAPRYRDLNLSPEGQILFAFQFESPDSAGPPHAEGLWRTTSDGIRAVASRGEPVASTGTELAGYADPHFVCQDQIAFQAVFYPGSPDRDPVTTPLVESDGKLSLALRPGEPIPDFADAYWDLLFFDFDFNDRGVIAFSDWDAELGASSYRGNRLSIALGDASRVVLQAGDEISIGPDDVRILASIGDLKINDSGQLAVIAHFTDGWTAVLVSEPLVVPEPSTLGIAALFSMVVMCSPAQRRRRGTLSKQACGRR